jgi:hypothetical protein
MNISTTVLFYIVNPFNFFIILYDIVVSCDGIR